MPREKSKGKSERTRMGANTTVCNSWYRFRGTSLEHLKLIWNKVADKWLKLRSNIWKLFQTDTFGSALCINLTHSSKKLSKLVEHRKKIIQLFSLPNLLKHPIKSLESHSFPDKLKIELKILLFFVNFLSIFFCPFVTISANFQLIFFDLYFFSGGNHAFSQFPIKHFSSHRRSYTPQQSYNWRFNRWFMKYIKGMMRIA